jgi:hypothetical protein
MVVRWSKPAPIDPSTRPASPQKLTAPLGPLGGVGFLCSRGRALDDEKGSHNLRTPGSRRAVMMLLSDEEWSNWSNREIARCCAVNLDLVNRIRNTSSLNDSVSERTYTTKQCTVATMNTSAIGPRRR